MIQEEIEKTFYNDQKLPVAIGHVCAYSDIHGYPISGCFELSTIGMDDLRGRFKTNPSALDELLPFGRGACGDVYALWLTNNLKPEAAPVVMFGSEGELLVLAKNAEEFCMLLCLGYSEIGLEDHSKPGVDFPDTEQFRNHIQGIYKFSLPKNAEGHIIEANNMFPSFSQWVEINAWGECS